MADLQGGKALGARKSRVEQEIDDVNGEIALFFFFFFFFFSCSLMALSLSLPPITLSNCNDFSQPEEFADVAEPEELQYGNRVALSSFFFFFFFFFFKPVISLRILLISPCFRSLQAVQGKVYRVRLLAEIGWKWAGVRMNGKWRRSGACSSETNPPALVFPPPPPSF